MEVKMEQEFSTLKKIKNLALALVCYLLIGLLINLLLDYLNANPQTVATTIFLFIIYGLLTLISATINFKVKLSIKAFKALLYISLGIIFSGLLNLAATFIIHKTLTDVNSWASIIGGGYLFLFWGLGHNNLTKK